MELDVGVPVAYPPHGVGRVVLREERAVLGVVQEVVVVELADGLAVTLPLDRAREHLRAPATAEDVLRVGETLRAEEPLDDDTWAVRVRATQTKLRGGDLLELAAIVRDGARRERARAAAGGLGKLSASEQALCTKARKLLSGEIGLACGLDEAGANAWIDDQIAPTATDS